MAESRDRGGSCFRFTARFGRAQQEQEAPPVRARQLGALKVLVVDDNAAAREIMHGILASMQMRAVSAVDASAAIAELLQAEADGDPYQVVLMDWIMPSMDGLAAIRAIRANPAISRTLSIIMVTAYSRDELIAQASDVPRLGVLDKPVTPSSVLDAIVDGLYQHGGAVAAAAPALPRRSLAAALHALKGRARAAGGGQRNQPGAGGRYPDRAGSAGQRGRQRQAGAGPAANCATSTSS